MEDPDMVAYAGVQPVPMSALEVLGQNLQALTQIVGSQQQIFDQQQEWFRQGHAPFKMPKMTKDENPEAYIEAFERHALMTGLPQEHWASQLGALVVGVAQAAYRAILREEAGDYERVKQAILYQLEISPDYYRHLFWAKKRPDERRPQVLLQLLQDLLDKWVSPVGSDSEGLADQVILEQFQIDLDERMQCWVRQHAPRNCEEALKLAEAYAAAEASYPKERRNPKPASPPPREAEWRQAPIRGAGKDVVCFRCGQRGHLSRECPTQPAARWVPANQPRGFPNRRRGTEVGEPMDCRYASCEGNATWSRPTVKAWVDGRPVRATLDSGCAQFMVRADMVQRREGREAPPVTVACLHGETERVR
ncbi:hypothetical protein Y1Q_0007947 [Alligator mississippiensis]|uniref:CCHC-type domain-containing protein n=1 Tax=Alligator mississippiensis TaxID=8496 RepID=A0A151NFC9_ALLMI|nr:hypothetical protein Y1Q_0007947 [Alligator mississippiensis]